MLKDGDFGVYGFGRRGVSRGQLSSNRFPFHSWRSVKLYIFLFLPTYVPIQRDYRTSTSSAVSGRILGITCQDPDDSKSNQLHVDNRFRFFFIDLRHIL